MFRVFTHKLVSKGIDQSVTQTDFLYYERNTMIHTEQIEMSVGELSRHIEAGIEPVRRSTHIGNQPPRELVIMAGLPTGVDVLMVDTIQGDDPYTQPNKVLMADENRVLTSRRKAQGIVVEHVTDQTSTEAASVADFHTKALERLTLNNPPMPMMKFFASKPDLLAAAVQACHDEGLILRSIDDYGKFRPLKSSVDRLYTGGKSTGAVLPLVGMMALDMMISHEQGSKTTLHLAGNDMIQYTANKERMHMVSNVFTRAMALLGMGAVDHTYRILDSRGLASMTNVPSQHAVEGSALSIDLSRFAETSTGIQS